VADATTDPLFDEPLDDPARAFERDPDRLGEPGDADGPANVVGQHAVLTRGDPAGSVTGVEGSRVRRVNGLGDEAAADVAIELGQQLEASERVFGAESQDDAGNG